MKIKAKSPKQIELRLEVETSYDLSVLRRLLESVATSDIDVEELKEALLAKVKELGR